MLIIVKGGKDSRRKAIEARDLGRRMAEKGAAITALERKNELDHKPYMEHRKDRHGIANEILAGHSLKKIEQMARRSI